MKKYLARIIYLIVGASLVTGAIHISWLRESEYFVITPGLLLAILAVLLSYYVIGCYIWDTPEDQFEDRL